MWSYFEFREKKARLTAHEKTRLLSADRATFLRLAEVYRSSPNIAVCLENGQLSGGGGGGDRSEAWDRETMFSQLAKRSSQNVDSGVRHNKYFRSIEDQLIWNSFQNLCVFCRGKVSGEQLISHGTYCQFRTREYSMEATSVKTLLFSHCLVCCSGEWISCELYSSHVSLVYTWRTGLRQTFQSWNARIR